jgi:hypothetical protein
MDLDYSATPKLIVHGGAAAPQAPSQRREKLWQRKRREGKERRGRRVPNYAQRRRAPMPRIIEEDEEDGEAFGNIKVEPKNPFAMKREEYIPTNPKFNNTKEEHGEPFGSDYVGFEASARRPQQHQQPQFRTNSEAYACRKGSRKVHPRSARELMELRKRHDKLGSYIDKTKRNIEKRSVWTKKEAEQTELEASVGRDLEAIRKGLGDLAMGEGSHA